MSGEYIVVDLRLGVTLNKPESNVDIYPFIDVPTEKSVIDANKIYTFLDNSLYNAAIGWISDTGTYGDCIDELNKYVSFLVEKCGSIHTIDVNHMSGNGYEYITARVLRPIPQSPGDVILVYISTMAIVGIDVVMDSCRWIVAAKDHIINGRAT